MAYCFKHLSLVNNFKQIYEMEGIIKNTKINTKS